MHPTESTARLGRRCGLLRPRHRPPASPATLRPGPSGRAHAGFALVGVDVIVVGLGLSTTSLKAHPRHGPVLSPVRWAVYPLKLTVVVNRPEGTSHEVRRLGSRGQSGVATVGHATSAHC